MLFMLVSPETTVGAPMAHDQAAALVAQIPPMATGLTARKIAKGLYIMPPLFAYTPFLAGGTSSALGIFAFGTVGIYGLTAAIEGYAESSLNWPLRAALAAVGVLLLWPVFYGPSTSHGSWRDAGCSPC